MGHSEAVFYFISVFSIQLTVNKCSINFADDWIRTTDLWYRKQPLYQLSRNLCPTLDVQLKKMNKIVLTTIRILVKVEQAWHEELGFRIGGGGAISLIWDVVNVKIGLIIEWIMMMRLMMEIYAEKPFLLRIKILIWGRIKLVQRRSHNWILIQLSWTHNHHN